MKSFRSTAFLLLVLALNSQADTSIEQITVTASRTAAAIDDVGSSVHIISKEEIVRRSAPTLASLLRDVPGMTVSQPGPLGTLAQVRMRGAEANQVLVMIDGIEANDIAQGGGFNFAHVLTNDIERVEIVRGPQSALWGSDALAGVINIITRPHVRERRANIDIESGSFGTHTASASISQPLDNGGFSLGATRVTSDGTNISRTGDEDDGYDNTTLRGDARFNVTDNVALQGMARWTDSRVDFDAVDSVNTGLPVDAPFVTESTQSYAKLALIAQVTDHIEQIIEIHHADTNNTNRTNSPVDDVTRGRKQALNLQTNIDFGLQQLALVAEHERDNYEQRGQATPFGDPNKDLDSRRNSFAVEWRLDTDAFSVSASARHENNAAFEDANTWRLTGLWKATDATGLFASWGRSIKNPTFTERFGFFDTFTGNPALEPEHSRAWELGIRHIANDRLNASISYFQARLVDEINGFVFDPAEGSFTARNIDGESKRKGVEFDARWLASETLSLSASYTWLDATQPDATGTQVEEIRRPRNSASLRANFDLERLNVNVGANYSGRQLDTFFPPFPQPSRPVQLDSYTLIDATARYQLRRNLVLSARVENALDESYEEVFGFRSPGFGVFAGIEFNW